MLKEGMEHLSGESQSGTIIAMVSADTAVFEGRALSDAVLV